MSDNRTSNRSIQNIRQSLIKEHTSFCVHVYALSTSKQHSSLSEPSERLRQTMFTLGFNLLATHIKTLFSQIFEHFDVELAQTI